MCLVNKILLLVDPLFLLFLDCFCLCLMGPMLDKGTNETLPHLSDTVYNTAPKAVFRLPHMLIHLNLFVSMFVCSCCLFVCVCLFVLVVCSLVVWLFVCGLFVVC